MVYQFQISLITFTRGLYGEFAAHVGRHSVQRCTLLYISPPYIKPLFVWQDLKIPSFRIDCD